jgi:hypothetical protein
MNRRSRAGRSALYTARFLPFLTPARSGEATEKRPQPPETKTPAGPRPSEIVKELAGRRPPELTGTGEVAQKNALAFIEWAASSTRDQAEIVRKAVAEAGRNPDIMGTFCKQAFEKQPEDHSGALVVLSLIGEARSKHGEECLVKFMALPFPEKGTVVDGEILEQTALATLQAKAIDGLAYLRSDTADKLVFEAVAKHPSRIVRAEAIAAYLWNHDSSDRAKEALKPYVRKEELIFLDRVVKREGEPKESFNRKLEAYLKLHPEMRPPAPEKAQPQPRPTVGKPPAF